MNYCLWPWTHLYFHTDKHAYPCCKLAGIEKFRLGKSSDSVDKLWNAEPLKDIRKTFLVGEVPVECMNCCIGTPHPLNIHIPKEHIPKKNEYYKNTLPDGTFGENFVIYNLAASNVCNFRCAYCSIAYSSRFSEKDGMKRLFGETPLTVKKLTGYDDKRQMMESFAKQAPYLTKIYFSGGESHLQEIYYDMLDELLRQGLLDIDMEFITNLSGYTFQGRNVFELLSRFRNATVVGSVDTYGQRAEYIRYGTKWSDVEATRRHLLNYPNIKFLLQPVVTNLSMFSLPDLHRDWYENGFVGKGNIRYIVLESPTELRINNTPKALKEKVVHKYDDYLGFLQGEESTDANRMKVDEKVCLMLNTLCEPPTITTDQLKLFLAKENLVRTMKYQDIFTNLQPLPLL